MSWFDLPDDDGSISFRAYDGILCPNCGAKFWVDPPTHTTTREAQCPNCRGLLQVRTTVNWAKDPPFVNDHRRCVQCRRNLPAENASTFDPIGALLNDLGIDELCEECQWMADNAERRNRGRS